MWWLSSLSTRLTALQTSAACRKLRRCVFARRILRKYIRYLTRRPMINICAFILILIGTGCFPHSQNSSILLSLFYMRMSHLYTYFSSIYSNLFNVLSSLVYTLVSSIYLNVSYIHSRLIYILTSLLYVHTSSILSIFYIIFLFYIHTFTSLLYTFVSHKYPHLFYTLVSSI